MSAVELGMELSFGVLDGDLPPSGKHIYPTRNANPDVANFSCRRKQWSIVIRLSVG
jgi:hypothetical protein